MRRYLLAAVVLLIFAPKAEAQTTVSGTVIDESGAALTEDVVTHAGTGVRLTVTTGPIGEYRFANVPPGTYQLTVLLVGFAPERENVVVGTDEARLPAMTLPVASFEEAVIVTASRVGASLLDAPATMTVLPGSTLASLPARNVGDLCARCRG